MADDFDNVNGKLDPDGLDDSTASAGAKLNAENYKKQAAQASQGTSAGPIQSQAETDTLNMVLAAVAANAGLVQEKEPEKDFQVKLTRPVETPSVYLGSQLQTGGVAPTGNYYDLRNDGFLELTNQTLIDKVTQASKDPTKRDAIYRLALDRAAILNKSGKDVSVEEVLDGFIKNGVPGVGGSGSAGGPFSTTSRAVSLTNEGTSRQLLNNALTGYLGRQATVEENSIFLKALNVQEKANPTTTVTKGNVSGRNTTQTQNTTGGFDRNDFTERFAKSQEGYAEYQTATTYLDAFIGALEDKSRVVG